MVEKVEHMNELCSAVILVGGKSSRFGSPKHLAICEGQTFLSKITKTLSPIDTYYSINHERQLTPLIDAHKAITDKYDDIGPLGGIATSLSEINSNFILVTSCDVPLISNKLVNQIIGYAIINNKSVVAEIDGKLMPTFAVYKKDDYDHFVRAITNKCYRLTSIVTNIDHCKFDANDFRYELTNVNTKDQLYNLKPFVFCVSGFKNSGKTTLITSLTKKFKEDNFTISILKHDGHDFAIDNMTDTGKFLECGASPVTIYSSIKYQTTYQMQLDYDQWLQSQSSQVVIIEGMKYSSFPKIALNIDEQLTNCFLYLNEQTRNDIHAIYKYIRKEMDERYK